MLSYLHINCYLTYFRATVCFYLYRLCIFRVRIPHVSNSVGEPELLYTTNHHLPLFIFMSCSSSILHELSVSFNFKSHHIYLLPNIADNLEFHNLFVSRLFYVWYHLFYTVTLCTFSSLCMSLEMRWPSYRLSILVLMI